ncbi:MAG: hypothetical protein ACTTJK_02295 [Phocaeicola sp.]|uniref:hypothetical protein n=1 Tax=Phocaeicola sp. TaxID=2773926 RepID=UPI003FA08065
MKNSLFRMGCMAVLLFVASLTFAQSLPHTIQCGPFREGHIIYNYVGQDRYAGKRYRYSDRFVGTSGMSGF